MAIKTYLKKSNVKVEDNFKASEFSCKGKGCCATVKIDTKLAKYLQKIRDHFGKSITITSGYRCIKHNKAVGGASSSYHTKGMAADIKVKDVAPREVAKYAESIGILGIGLYETDSDGHFTHVDTRSKKSFWYGQKQVKRKTFGGSKYSHEDFVEDVQKAIGAKVDGKSGPDTLSKTVTVSAKYNRKHAVVKPIQKYLCAIGYTEIGEADGEAGPAFDKAVKHFQKDNGCVVDGKITAKKTTWKKLLKL